MALRTGEEHDTRVARFWARIFAIDFAMGAVTGTPMEFQPGTSWPGSRLLAASDGESLRRRSHQACGWPAVLLTHL
jgi:hypothetical protein